MLIEIKKLSVDNKGFKRDIALVSMFVNPANIISLSDYYGAENFLKEEKSSLAGEQFSVMRISLGSETEEIIVHGSSKHLCSKLGTNNKERVLNG